MLQPPSLDETVIVPAWTTEQWANQPPRLPPRPRPDGPPRTANERRAAARRQAAREAAATAAQRRAQRRGASQVLKAVGPSIAKASGSMAIATLVSRVTGFARNLILAAALGIGGVSINDAYNAANTLPNMLLEFVLGGVLTSVAVPLLVRARNDDEDGGTAYTQRLLTMALVVLGVATVIAVVLAPVLISITVSDTPGSHTRDVATVLAYLLLPEIFFYGLSALVNAILNARDVFGPTAWAPVLANVVTIATAALFMLLPGEVTLNPASLSDPKLLVLGIGTTLGIAVQAFAVLPALRRTRFRFRWRWGLDPRLREFGGLALWTLAYVGVSQVGVVILSRVATGSETGGLTIYNYTWLLVQLPYGVIGFSLLTAILPRMSRAAAEGNRSGLVDDLSFATRMCTVLLGPISGLMTVLGPQIGLGLFSIGQSDPSQATRLGLALTTSAFGLLAYTVTMVQMRAFYAMKDSRTPTLLMVIMVAVKIPLYFLCPVVLGPSQVVYGLTFVNAFGFIVGAVAGQVWLRRRLGNLDTRRVGATLAKTFLASVWGAAAALLVVRVLAQTGAGALGLAWPDLILGSVLGGAITLGVMRLVGVAELTPALNRITRLVKRG